MSDYPKALYRIGGHQTSIIDGKKVKLEMKKAHSEQEVLELEMQGFCFGIPKVNKDGSARKQQNNKIRATKSAKKNRGGNVDTSSE